MTTTERLTVTLKEGDVDKIIFEKRVESFKTEIKMLVFQGGEDDPLIQAKLDEDALCWMALAIRRMQK
jgi:hypothetical protein